MEGGREIGREGETGGREEGRGENVENESVKSYLINSSVQTTHMDEQIDTAACKTHVRAHTSTRTRARKRTHLAGWAWLLEAKVVTDNTQRVITSVII